jgi:hypothetical protein
MTKTDCAHLQNVARRLEAIRKELNELEDTMRSSDRTSGSLDRNGFDLD